MRTILEKFNAIETNIKYLAVVEFFLQLTHCSFFVLFNFYLTEKGFEDFEIADIVKYRYLGAMVLAFPFGLYIRGRKLQRFFKISAFALPTVSLLVIASVEFQQMDLLYLTTFLWGFLFILIQVSGMPYILLNSAKEKHSESISLWFQTFGMAIFTVGILNYGLNKIDPELFSVRNVLILFSLLGYCSVLFVFKLDKKENLSEKIAAKDIIKSYDWGKIAFTATPTLLIAVGAGLTIPFINLFFLHVHGIDSSTFSLLGSFTFILVTIAIFFIPTIKRKFGYEFAITLIQSLGVVVLIILGTTEYYKHLVWAAPLAIAMYLIRQPLMNTAGPMTTELTMYFVGERNQELLSAINASIWSGSWFVSSFIFGFLREQGLAYVSIIYITASMYVIAIIWFAVLIKMYKKRINA